MKIINKFLDQVIKRPDKLCLVSERKELTYEEVNLRSDQLTGRLQATMADQDHIGLLMGQDVDMVIAMLACLKGGQTYIPLSPDYPIHRLMGMIEEGEIKGLIVEASYMDLYEQMLKIQPDLKGIFLDNLDQERPGQSAERGALAYIMYTSGSTGKPKGIMQTQDNMAYFVDQYIKNMDLGPEDRMTLFSNYCHDASVIDIYACLCSGASLYIIDFKTTTTMDQIADFVNKHQLTLWHSVPSVYRSFMAYTQADTSCPSLRRLVLGGEALVAYDVQRLKTKFPNSDLYNLYGQTESSYNSGFLYQGDEEDVDLCLGPANQGIEMFIMNEEGEEADPFELGEIVIVNGGIALGYWQDPKRSQEVFDLEDPEERMYYTGDLGKLLADGTIRFEGRKDSQVKIRGYRVELGEIESALMKLEGVKGAGLLYHKDQDQDLLHAFVEGEISEDWSNALKKVLPDYMIPNQVQLVDQLPTTNTQKLDRLALKSMLKQETPDLVPVESETEKVLEAIIMDLLKLSQPLGKKGDFFALGGHSLKATQLVSRIHEAFDVNLAIADIFDQPRLDQLASLIDQGAREEFVTITPAPHKDYYPMSSIQERLYLVQELEKDSVAYNLPMILRFEGAMDVDKLRESFKQLIQRHEALRTSFAYKNDQGIQVIHPMDQVVVDFDYEQVDEVELDNRLNAFIQPFDLSKAQLIRIKVMKVKESLSYVLAIDLHHIITDGVSNRLIMEEVIRLYNGQVLEPVSLQYKDFSHWQNQVMDQEAFKDKLCYWKNLLDPHLDQLTLNTDFLRPRIKSSQGGQVNKTLSLELSQKMQNFSQATGASHYMIMLAAFTVLLHKDSGQKHIVIGSPLAGRLHSDLSGIVGAFINTLPMYNRVDASLSFSDFLSQVKANALEAYDHQEVQFDDIVKVVDRPKDLSRHPIFDVMLRINNMDNIGDDLSLEGLTLSHYGDTESQEKFDLTLTCDQWQGAYRLNFSYATCLFKQATIDRLSENLIKILDQVCDQPDLKIKEISYWEVNEKMALDQRLSDLSYEAYCNHGPKQCLQDLLRASFKKNTGKTAIEKGDLSYNYMWLDDESDRVYTRLVNEDLKAGDRIGLVLSDPVEVVVQMLAIFKGAYVYVPLNPSFPDGMLASMIEGVDFIISDKTNLERVKALTKTRLLLAEESRAAEPVAPYPTYKWEDDLYVCFTSGTSGQAKGIVGWNGALKHFIDWEKAYTQANERVRVGQLTNYSNDAYFRDILLPLSLGGTIVMPERPVKESSQEDLTTWLTEKGVSLLHCTPSLFNIFNHKDLRGEDYPHLDQVLLAGEPVIKDDIRRFYDKKPNTRVTNLYGTSETTLVKMYHEIKKEDLAYKQVPIGQPMSDTEIVIVRDQVLLHENEVGELWVKSPYLTRGYLNNMEQTQEKFVSLPGIDGLFYRTGDLAVKDPSGFYYYMGRMDDQVKIRGNRVELSAVDNTLMQLKGMIKTYTCILKKPDPRIVVYYQSDVDYNHSDIKNHLGHYLPDYMVASQSLQVDGFDLNENGKVNRHRLPEMRKEDPSQAYVPVSTHTEKVIESCFREVLDIREAISIKDNFFDIGGHSLALLKLADLIRRRLNLDELLLIDLYENPTIEEMAAHITSDDNQNRIFYELTKNKNNPVTVYAVPYMGGDASCFGALAREMDRSQSGITLMSTSIFDIGSEVDGQVLTVERFARQRAEEIKAQGHENVFVLGHCGGSVLAIALADELKRMKVPFKGIIASGLVIGREPNKIRVDALKRRSIRQFIVMLNGLGFVDKLTVRVAKKYRNALIEMISYRYRRKKKISHRIFKHKTPLFSIVARRDPETFNHKYGHKAWKRYSRRVKHIVIESRSHYFIANNADLYTEELVGFMTEMGILDKKYLSQTEVETVQTRIN